MQCPRCRHENPTGQNVCGKCGAGLPHGPSAARFPTADPHKPKPLATGNLALEVAFGREGLTQLGERYTPEERRVRRWLLLGVLATALVGVLGLAFVSGTDVLARYTAKHLAPVKQPLEQPESDTPAALARPLPESSPDPVSKIPAAHSANR
jgi:hypothetical protein